MNYKKNNLVKINIGVVLILLLVFVWKCNDKKPIPKFSNPIFTFNDITTNLEKRFITNTQIVQAIQSEKQGYFIKNIKIHNPRIAKVLVEQNNTYNIELKDIGIFTADIVFTHKIFPQKNITGTFIITGTATPELSFRRLITSKTKISEKKLLSQINGEKQGYHIKMIFTKNRNAIIKKNNIFFKKPGNFRVKIVLAKQGAKDVIIRNARFKILPKRYKLKFNTLITNQTKISFKQVFSQIRGVKKGYKIKNIFCKDSNITVDSNSIDFKKIGNYIVNITLKKQGMMDINIKNAKFKIMLKPAPILHFKPVVTNKKNISYQRILSQITGNKMGYKITDITCKDKYVLVENTRISFEKMGNFTTKILLQKQGAEDIIIKDAKFKIIESAPKLTFIPFIKDISTNKIILSKEIISNIKGPGKEGYTIKSITTEKIYAKVLGEKPNLTLNVQKIGTFTATIALEKKESVDITIDNAKFLVPFNLSFGGEQDDEFNCVTKVSEGYIATGFTESDSNGSSDFFVVKFNNSGNILWKKNLGGKYDDVASNIIQIQNKNIIIVGWTANKSKGEYDIWVVKLDKQGNLLWDKTFGGKDYDRAYCVTETKDNAIVLAGYTISKGAGESDIWIIKIDKQGKIIWDKTLGKAENELAFSIIETQDKGFVLAAITESKGKGDYDAWIVKLDKRGNLLWDKTFGQKGQDKANQIIQTKDNNFVVVGFSRSKRITPNFWVAKLNDKGKTLWKKNFGGKLDKANALIETDNDSYIIVGSKKNKVSGKYDGWVMKIDKQGNTLWDKTFGGKQDEHIKSITKGSNGKYILVGSTKSKGHGKTDAWVLQINENGNLQ